MSCCLMGRSNLKLKVCGGEVITAERRDALLRAKKIFPYSSATENEHATS